MSCNFFKYVLSLLLMTVSCLGSHFRGGIIMWESTGVNKQIKVSYRVAWRRSYFSTRCNENSIASGFLMGQGNMQCFSGCSGYVGTMYVQCTDFSESEDWFAGEHSYTFTSNSATDQFSIGFAGNAWISLNNGGGSWRLVSRVDLAARNDTGKVNASPRSAVAPITRVQYGCNTTIVIPVNDPDGDRVRCRWAKAAQSECGGVCQVMTGAVLDQKNCKIFYSATQYTGWYGVTLQVEDFVSDTATEALSSVPVQFLVNVFSSKEPCNYTTEFLPPTRVHGSCVGVPFNSTFEEQIIARSGADSISITEINTVSPIGMKKSALAKYSNTDRSWYVNITWSPADDQGGNNIFCFSASDSAKLESDQRCITLLGGVSPPTVVDGSQIPTGDILPSHNVWKADFDSEFVRPNRTTYMYLYSENGVQVTKTDVSASSDVIYPVTPHNRTLKFPTPPSSALKEKTRYYILLDDGVAKGTSYCGAESPAVRNISFWTFRVRDVTPPILQFTKPPSITNAKVTIFWTSNEEVSVRCILQTQLKISDVPCNSSWTGHGLSEGYYSIYITGTDLENNVGKQEKHTWRVDRTPPSVSFVNKPNEVSREQSSTITFKCDEYCTTRCSLHLEGSSPAFQDCGGTISWTTRSFTTPNLQTDKSYVFQVVGTDAVSNEGSVVSYKWQTDFSAPVLQTLPTQTVACGDPYYPNVTGTPTVSDTVDSSPTLTYKDTGYGQCGVKRIWTASDDAGNTVTKEQEIKFTSPGKPAVTFPSFSIVACGELEHTTNDKLIPSITVIHPCSLPTNITYTDPPEAKNCDVTFTRQWKVTDDCGAEVTSSQTIQVLKLQLPTSPAVGQQNMDLQYTLRWPIYPGSKSYKVYVWQNGLTKPSVPVSITANPYYRPSSPLPPGTEMLWQIEYVLQDDSIIPSPQWGFKTKIFVDLSVISITLPPIANSGRTFDISYTVKNVGNLTTTSNVWYDFVYISFSKDFGNARRVTSVKQRNIIFPDDGYSGQATIQLRNSDIGRIYVFVEADYYRSMDDFDRNNNRLQSTETLNILLTPPPDLRVDSVVIPSSSFSGEEINVRWTVKNHGSGTTAASLWYDGIYWSTDPFYNNTDQLLTTVVRREGLLSNAEYSQIKAINVPRKINGNFYVLIKTDRSNHVYEHLNEENNYGASQKPIAVTLTPPPDLKVKSITSPNNITTGDVLKVKWTVENVGSNSPYTSYWSDKVELISEATSSVFATRYTQFYGTLQPANTYEQSVEFEIGPNVPSGSFNVSLHIDYSDSVFEFTYEKNNFARSNLEVHQVLPDLQVETVDVVLLETDYNSQIKVSWKVKNNGIGRTLVQSWYDGVVISPSGGNSVFIEQNLKNVHITLEDSLFAGGSYSYNVTLSIPQTIHGECVIKVETDALKNTADNPRTNNIIISSALNIPFKVPDLNVTDIKIISSKLYSGEDIIVQTSVQNVKSPMAEAVTWTDRLILSTSDIVSAPPLATFYGQRTYKLLSNDTYSANITFKISRPNIGNYFLHFSANTGETLFEGHITNNNYKMLPISVEAPPSPDLTVEELSFTLLNATANRRIIDVTWRGTNIGNTMKDSVAWKDIVILKLSSNEISDNYVSSDIIGRLSVTAALEVLTSYTMEGSFVLSEEKYGTFDLCVLIDENDDAKEFATRSNNIKCLAGQVKIPAPPQADLEVQDLTVLGEVPPELIPGTKQSLSYRVSNVGERSTKATSWIDAVFIYPFELSDKTQILQNANKLVERSRVGSLEPGDSYEVQVEVKIPLMNSAAYFYIVPDVENVMVSSVSFALSRERTVSTASLPDLDPSLNTTVNEVSGGQPFQVSYSVWNNGNRPVDHIRYDSVYLSSDFEIDPFDKKLGANSITGLFPANITRDYVITVFLPFDLATGNYFLIVEVDTRNDIYESNEGNNQRALPLTIIQTVSSDIAVVDVGAPATASVGDMFTVTWSIRNNGTQQATGYKCDSVYLSSDNKWDITDQRVDDPICSSLIIPPYQSAADDKQYKLDSEVPLISASPYSVIVKSRSNIIDNDLENNVGVSDNETSVTVSLLQLETPITVTLNPRQVKAFRIPGILSDQTIIITTKSNSQDNFNSLKVRHGEMATSYEFDTATLELFLSDQTLVVANTNFGDYYVLLEHSGSLSKTSSSVQISLTAKLAKFEILKSSPKFAAPLGNVTLKIEGTLFPEGVSVHLRNDARTLKALQVIRLSSTLIFATFDIKNTDIADKFILEFVTSDKNITFNNALEIKTGIEGQAVAKVTLPNFLRPGETGLVYIDVQNIGDTDIKAPLLVIESKGIGNIRFVTNTKVTEFRQRHIMLAGPQDGLGGLLIPQQSSRMTFQVKQNDFETVGSMQISVVQITPREDTEHIFLDMKNEMRPSHYDDIAWTKVWNNFIGLVGRTGSSFTDRISQVANKFSEARRHVGDVESIVSYLLDIADGKNTDSFLLKNKDVQTSNMVNKVRLDITRTMSSRVGFRQLDGPFGKGWITKFWDTKLKSLEKENAVLTFEKTDYVFKADNSGSYVSSTLGTLVLNGNVNTYTDQQTGTVYAFENTTGQLMSVYSNVDESRITLTYDQNQRLTELKHSSGESVTVAYNQQGRVASTVLVNPADGRTQRSVYLYDISNTRLITVVNNEEESTGYTYNGEGALTSVLYPDETSMVIEYNERGLISERKAYESGELRQSMKYDYNEGGGFLKTLWPDNATLEYILNEDGDVAAIKRDSLLTNRWEQIVNSKTVYQGDSIVSKETFDVKTNTVIMEDGNKDSVQFEFDDHSTIKRLLDGEKNSYELQRYKNGMVDKYTFPDGTFEKFQYAQESFTVQSRNKVVKTYQTDDKGRVVYRDIGNEDSTSYLYDNQGVITEAVSSLGKIEMSFDKNRLPKRTSGPRLISLDYSFNRKGQKTGIKSSDGYDVKYTYNKHGQVTKVVNNVDGKALLTVAYDEKLRVRRKNLGNGAYVLYDYDKNTDMLKKLTNYRPDGSVASHFEYTYDARQRRVLMKATEGEWVFRYDSSGQVTFVQRPDGHVTEYHYDKRKNRKSVTVNGKTYLYQSNNLNQYTSVDNGDVFKHDLNGNLKSKAGTHPGQYTFDADNKLTSFNVQGKSCSLRYDALDNLHEKNCDGHTKRYLMDIHGGRGPDVLTEYEIRGSSEEKTSYFYGGDQLGLVALQNKDGYFYYHFDPIGTVVALLSENGTTVNSYRVDPFGQTIASSEAVKNPFKYVGQWGVMNFDEIPEMYYMRARFYDSDTGKFLSIDPLGIHGKSKNFYAYVYNNPIHFSDPKGTIAPFVVGGLISLAVDTGFKLATGQDLTWGGAASALVTGMIGGAFAGPITKAVSGTGLKALGQYYVKTHLNINVNVLNALVGSLTESLISDKPFKDLIGNNMIDALLTSFIPGTKWQTVDALLGKIVPFLLRDGFSDRFDKMLKEWSKRGDLLQRLVDDAIQWILSRDPNDMLGPMGYGAAKFISTNFVMEYKIRFENDPNATAPAQRVYIEHVFDDDLNPRTFKVGTFGFGNYTHELPMDRSTLQVSINLTADYKIFLNVRGGLDIVNGKATWEFQSVDPATGEAPTDPSLGFLPPNNGTTGQGYVTFSIQPKEDAGSLAQIDAVAAIFFDNNEPIDTPVIFNTIDSTAPVMNASIITETLSSGILTISLSNLDVGSGVKEVDILQKQGSGYTLLMAGVSETIAVLPLQPGGFYELLPSPVDYVGNRNSLQSGQTLSVYFPPGKVSCEGVNNCTNNGNCSGVNICICNPGRYGSDCSKTIAPPEPPILEATTTIGIENTPFSMNLKARPLEGEADEIYIIIKGYPQGFLFNKGKRYADYVRIPSEDFGSLLVTPPPGYYGTFNIKVTANATTNGTSSERSNILKIAIARVLDVQLHISPSCYSNNSKDNITFSVSIEADSGDKLVYQSIRLMVPSVLVLEDGNMTSDGEYTLDVSYLNKSLMLTGSNESISGMFYVNITINVLDNNVLAIMTDSVMVTECSDETTTDMPTTTATTDNTYNTTTATSSNQTVTPVTSTSETLNDTVTSQATTISTQSNDTQNTSDTGITSSISTGTSLSTESSQSTATMTGVSGTTPISTGSDVSNETKSTSDKGVSSTATALSTEAGQSTATTADLSTGTTTPDTETQTSTDVETSTGALTTTTLQESGRRRTSLVTVFNLIVIQNLQINSQLNAVKGLIRTSLLNFFKPLLNIVDIIVNSLRKGSLIVDYDIITAATDTNVTQKIPHIVSVLASGYITYNGTNVSVTAVQVKKPDGTILNVTSSSSLCEIQEAIKPCSSNSVCVEKDLATTCKYQEPEDDFVLVIALSAAIVAFFFIFAIVILVCSRSSKKKKTPTRRQNNPEWIEWSDVYFDVRYPNEQSRDRNHRQRVPHKEDKKRHRRSKSAERVDQVLSSHKRQRSYTAYSGQGYDNPLPNRQSMDDHELFNYPVYYDWRNWN